MKKINKEKKSIILNCGYGKGISVLEAVKEFQRQTRKKIEVIVKGRRKGDMEKTAGISKIKKFIKWRPKII